MGGLLSLRFLRPLLLASVFAFALFWTLHLLIEGGKRAFDQSELLPTIDFVRLKRASELETKQRVKPERPPPPKQPPPPPKLKVAAQDAPRQSVPFAMPNLGLAPGIGGGPFIGAIGTSPGGFGDGDIIPLVRIAPQYPRQAALDGVEGTVTLEFTVNADGTVRNVKIRAAKPPGYFEQAAVAAALKWKFKPKVVDGKPVEQRGIQPMDFKMNAEE